MQMVIDIPDDIYVGLFDVREITGGECAWLLSAVKNGTPLPKGHGDLKDVDEIERIWKKGNFVRSALLFAPTIIKADKEA